MCGLEHPLLKPGIGLADRLRQHQAPAPFGAQRAIAAFTPVKMLIHGQPVLGGQVGVAVVPQSE